MDRVRMMEDLHNEKLDVYEAKNADYGDSFAKVRKEYPEAIVVRLMDKLERLKTLLKGSEQKVTDESIEDTLLDMSNYCDMEIIERRVDKLMKCEGVCNESEDVHGVVEKKIESMELTCKTDCYWNGNGKCKATEKIVAIGGCSNQTL